MGTSALPPRVQEPTASRQKASASTQDRPGKSRRRSRDKTREELQFAMLRVKNKGVKLTISAVALEAGVTPALIHNTYPDLAEAIRSEIGKATRKQRDQKGAELAAANQRLKELRAEVAASLADIQKLASINESLRQELTMLRSASSGSGVALLRK